MLRCDVLSCSHGGTRLPYVVGSIITVGVVWGVGGENDQEGKSPVLYDISYLCASCSVSVSLPVRPNRTVAPYKADLVLAHSAG